MLQFVKIQFLTNTLNFGKGFILSRVPESAFFEGLILGLGLLYKVCPMLSITVWPFTVF